MIDQMAAYLMARLTTVKFFHWATTSYAEHQALGAFYDTFSSWVDEVVEAAIGASGGTRFQEPGGGDEVRYQDASVLLSELKAYLVIDFPVAVNRSPDLLNMRDELLGQIHKTLYLLSMK